MTTIPPARVGDPADAIDTPALVVDLDAFEHNLAKMAAITRKAGVRLRPHAKTHRCPAVALKQIALGAVGQCCQKVGEAEAMVRGGVKDVLVSNEVIGLSKLRRLAALAKDATVGLCFDAPEAVAQASQAAVEFGVEIGALVEIEIGMKRCGIAPEGVLDLARLIQKSPGLKFLGLQAYHGAAQHVAGFAAREAVMRESTAVVRRAAQALADAGLPCTFITGAGTGTYNFESASGVWNEIQAGSYAFMDTDYARIGGKDSNRFADFEHSLFVLATVMSTPASDIAVVDAGLKAYSMEKGAPWVHGVADAEVVGVSDEHGKIKFGAGAKRLNLGDRVMLIPGHCDPTINLHDWYVGIRNGRVEALWPIAARGASR